MNEENIEDILRLIETAEEDGQWDVVDSLLRKASVVLLADIDRLIRTLAREFETKS